MADATDIIDATVASTNVVEHPREVLRKLREKLAEAAQQIIDALDAIDGDPDMEPSLGSLGSSVTNSWADIPAWSGGASDEREDEHDGRENEEDAEHDGAEPDEFHECGDAPFSMNQEGVKWAYGDREATYIQPAVDRRALSAATGRAADIQQFETDGKGNATFTLDGAPMQGGPLR